MSCPAAPLIWSRRGCASIPASRWCAVTGRALMARQSAGRCRTRCRPATGGTCGMAWPGVTLKEVAAHSSCRAAAGPPRRDGKHAETTAERWQQIHDLLDKGTGLLECSRRLHLSLNTVKRYARAAEPERIIRPPRYRATLVDPYRHHLRQRRALDPPCPSPGCSLRSASRATPAA